jgi:molecular chaperone DnaK
MANIIGIDLGTTYSAIARLDPTGRPEIVRDPEGQNLTPSVVLVEGPEALVVGQDAKQESYTDQEDRVAEGFKRRMDSQEAYERGGISFTPTQLSAFVLRKLVQGATETIGEIQKAVVTVPANFANKARTATVEAGRIAGIEVEHIVNEPTAAAFYYASTQDVNGRVAVYDLGGGTFDISIVNVRGQDVEVLASAGNARLGGKDFDDKLLELLRKRYEAETGQAFEFGDQHLDGGKHLEDLKKTLSKRDSVTARIRAPDGSALNLEVSRADFEESISTLITKAEMLVEAAMEEAGIQPGDLNHAVLVGGSTRVPAVRTSVERLFGQSPLTSVNVDEVVALGAALYAGYKADATELSAAQAGAMSNVNLAEICNHFFGTVIIDIDTTMGRAAKAVAVIIRKNVKVPASHSETYYTMADGQTNVHCVVTQSTTDETDPRWVTTVWEGDLGPLPPGRPQGQEIRVTYSYDENSIMHCHFEDVASGTPKEVRLDVKEGERSADRVDVDQFLIE